MGQFGYAVVQTGPIQPRPAQAYADRLAGVGYTEDDGDGTPQAGSVDQLPDLVPGVAQQFGRE
jgi:hypothetical protein